MSKTKSQYSKYFKGTYGGSASRSNQYSKQNKKAAVHCSACNDSDWSATSKRIEHGIVKASVFVAIMGLIASVIDILRAMILFSST